MISNELAPFKRFFTDHFNAVVRFATVYTGDADEARDIAQETFIRIYERWDDLPTPEETRSFMYATARNLSISRLRHQNVEEQTGLFASPRYRRKPEANIRFRLSE